MKISRGTFGVLFAAVLFAWIVVATADSGSASRSPRAQRPGFPRVAGRLLFAQPFELAQSYRHDWERERGEFAAGYIVVIEVDEHLARPRQERMPVLFVGERALERISLGSPGGRIVGVLPVGELEPFPFDSAPVFWDRPALPERLDRGARVNARVRAERAGIGPTPTGELAAALRNGGAPIELADRTALVRHAARLMLTWAPRESERARGMLAPLVR